MKMRNMPAIIAAAGLLVGGHALAAEPTNFDYAGLPIIDTTVEEAARYTTIPTSLIMPECEIIENQDDYTGVEATRCVPNGDADVNLEWSYLY